MENARSIFPDSLFRSSTLANSAQAKKRAKQAEKRRKHNASMKSMMRSSVKSIIAAISAGDKTEAEAAFKKVVPMLDRMARKGLIHKNKAARYKSRFNTQIREISA